MRNEHKRAALQPFKRKRNGEIRWYARGFATVREDDGSVSRRRFELRTEATSRAACLQACQIINERFDERFANAQSSITFARAEANYEAGGHDPGCLMLKILPEIGTRRCVDIDDTVMTQLVQKLAPKGAPSYVNRHIYTPVKAILRRAIGAKDMHELPRPHGHKKRKGGRSIDVPPESWFDAIAPHTRPELHALVTFLTCHGRRLGEPLNMTPAELRDNTIVAKTKNGTDIYIELADPVIAALARLDPARPYLFGYGPQASPNVRRDIREACDKAGVKYYHPHAFGRHAFATRLLKAGYSLKHVQLAGGWETIEMVANLYGHIEQSGVRDTIKSVADVWAAARVMGTEWGRARANNTENPKKTRSKP